MKAWRTISFLSGLLISSGCSIIPAPKADPTRFYVLSTSATSSSAISKPDAPSLQINAIDVASYLRAPALVVRRGDNEVEFRDYARWGESLELGIGRVLREELLARGAVGTVSLTGTRRESGNPDFTLSLRVLAFEGAADGAVVFRAIWEVKSRDKDTKASVVAGSGDFRSADLRWDGKTEASLAAQLSQAVAGLAGDVSAAIAKK